MPTIRDIAAGEQQYHVLVFAMPYSWVMDRLDGEQQMAADPYALVELDRDDLAVLRANVSDLLNHAEKQPMGVGRGSTTRKRRFPRRVIEGALARIDEVVS